MVVIKRPRATRPSTEDVARLRREYELLSSLAVPEVVRAIGFEAVDGGAALVSEDGGDPVAVFARKQAREIGDFLRTAVAVSHAIRAIHVHSRNEGVFRVGGPRSGSRRASTGCGAVGAPPG